MRIRLLLAAAVALPGTAAMAQGTVLYDRTLTGAELANDVTSGASNPGAQTASHTGGTGVSGAS